MKHGTVNCSCGQMFYFETLTASIKCIKCQKVYNTESYPEKPEDLPLEDPTTEEVGEEDGINI